MSLLDIIILMVLLLAIVMGAYRGLRSGLYLMVTLLSMTLAVLLLTVPIEKVILNIVGIGSEKYPDAPAVAVLILEGKTGAAYVAALLPALIVLSLLLMFGLIALRIDRVKHKMEFGIVSRIIGASLGLCSGILLIFLFAAQLLRLPWPPSNQWLRESLIISTLSHIARPVLSVMTGGP